MPMVDVIRKLQFYFSFLIVNLLTCDHWLLSLKKKRKFVNVKRLYFECNERSCESNEENKKTVDNFHQNP